MKLVCISTINMLTAFNILVNTAFCLPPQLTSVNEFIKSHSYLSQKNTSFRCTIDFTGNANLIYYEPADNPNKSLMKFISFNPSGEIRVESKLIIENFWELELNENECKIATDFEGNTHLIMQDMNRTFERAFYTYIMVDSWGKLIKRLEIQESFILSSISVMEDGTLIAHGGFGGFDAPVSEIVLVLRKDQNEFDSFNFETTDLGEGIRISNIGAAIMPLKDNILLILNVITNQYLMKTIVRKTIVDLNSKRVESEEIFNAREVSSIEYYNRIPNISILGKHFIILDNEIAFLFALTGVEKSGVPSDSMCVIIFDNHGSLVGNEARKSFAMTAGRVELVGKNDFLIRNNRGAFGDLKYTAENRLSLYGIISFRNFPEIIIDDGME